MPIILIIAMTLAVASIPQAIGQTLTTMTNVFTTTGFYTNNVYSANTIGTTTETVVSSNTFVSTADTLSGAASRAHCYFDPWNITVSPGTTAVTGTIGPPSSEIDFLILTQSQYVQFYHSSCGSNDYAAETAVYGLTTTYSLNWQNPPAGWYYFIFLSETAQTNAVITPFVLVATFSQVQTSAVVNVITNQVTGTTTQIATSVQLTQASAEIISGLTPEIIGGIIAVVLVAVVALYVAKTRLRTKPVGNTPPDRKVSSTVAKKTDDKLFCLECGKQLPAGSKFCNKCGTAQE